MSVFPKIQDILDKKQISYKLFPHPFEPSAISVALSLGIDPQKVIQASILRDEASMLMVIYPATGELDLEGLNKVSQRDFSMLTAYQVCEVLPTCEEGICAPIASIYNLGAIVDESLSSADPVYMVLDSEHLCQITNADFFNLQGGSVMKKLSIVKDDLPRSRMTEMPQTDVENRRNLIRQRLQNMQDLPAMPKVAHEVLLLSADPYANATDLGGIIEQDPSLSAQIIRYSRSPFYGYKGDVESIQDAISRVLGFDMVLDLAMGVSVGKAFRNPEDGPLGLNEFWRHATYSAALVQQLGKAVNSAHRPRPGMAYLSGLLHNFGLLLLGHLFPHEFSLLNNAVQRNPKAPIVALESGTLGVTHMELGSWLMEAWDMPGELITSIKEHHNGKYQGVHAVYPNLVFISNRLLNTIGSGDEVSNKLPGTVMSNLGLTEEQVLEIFDDVMEKRESLDYMAVQMVA
ncbi:MAG: HDOD domain-containing protein [Gammaproteobacteria bacterium]|nr:HDOD domain-containing protein [Gammaproteobacteria bacterium]